MMDETWLDEEQLQTAVDYWGKQLIRDDCREAFERALRAVLVEAARTEGSIWLTVDYDPVGELLDAVRDAGIECRGCAFSAREVFRCNEKTTIILRPGKVLLSEGYAAPYAQMWPSDVETVE